MLTLPEQQTVRQALEHALATTAPRIFITTTFAPHHQDMLRQLPTDLVTPAQYATYVLSYCVDSRWTLTPALLDMLLNALVTAGAGALAPLQARVAAGPAEDPNRGVADAQWVNETLPFFSRSGVRPVIMRLLETDAQPILRVTGPPDSGKSYTRELLAHVCAETRPDIQVVTAEIPEGAGPSYPPEELADTLVTPTTRDVSTRPTRSTSSYAAALCRWVLNAAINSPGRWTYVLDGFNQPDVQAETRELVQALAASIAGPGAYRKRMRLVLIDYPTSLPRVQLGALLDDAVPAVTTLKAPDIAACLSAHYDDMHRRFGRPKPPATVLDTVATGLLAKAVQKPEPLNQLNIDLTILRLTDLGRPVPQMFPAG